MRNLRCQIVVLTLLSSVAHAVPLSSEEQEQLDRLIIKQLASPQDAALSEAADHDQIAKRDFRVGRPLLGVGISSLIIGVAFTATGISTCCRSEKRDYWEIDFTEPIRAISFGVGIPMLVAGTALTIPGAVFIDRGRQESARADGLRQVKLTGLELSPLAAGSQFAGGMARLSFSF